MDSLAVFQQFVPQNAAVYCNELYEKLAFQFKIKKARQTKLGDFRYDNQTKRQVITVNNDLNPYSFLITYIHEVAHLVTYKRYSKQVKPHGIEWKNNFKELMHPLLVPNVFPEPLLSVLKNYFKNPAASSCADPKLMVALRKYDTHKPNAKHLSEVKIGEEFTFQNRFFRKIEKKRTRSLCLEIATNRKFLISEVAEVS